MVSTAAFHARVRGLVPGLGGLKETKMFLPHPRVKVSIVGSLRDRFISFHFVWVTSGVIEMLIKNICKNMKILKKIKT